MPSDPLVVEISQRVTSSPSLTLGGLHVYHGAIQHVRTAEARQAAAAARVSVDALVAAGLEKPLVTGGGTGTFMFEVAAGTHDEVQPGSYLFMDGDYGQNEDASFEQSLFVHATVISSDEASGKRVVDAGTKALCLLSGQPTLATPTLTLTGEPDGAVSVDPAAVSYSSGGDEHGILRGVPAGALPVGSTVQLVPSHCDPCVNMYDCILGVRAGVVEATFPIDARGPG
eukprot:CAMPEP_0181228206 /NCGR_PEP_ID=MMETSP1096-20121128/33226_1 /TAXON_ID=156174 ORGANISM="Chrysochromulina ericina, Strain CCMP281" /NCGR_SAMPLE_ID=MMETSP1096 /ASSEMBLY_ACC=CAM_ASM_000453 /LENGTH=227 /DNA_ID=CAMNT_0023321719 /DNA_START=21 /DNA_END=705 /DNA_ORIENTATION=+